MKKELRWYLREALLMTQAVADGPITPDKVRALLAQRAPVLAEATKARDEGESWGAEEVELADTIRVADRKLIDALWKPRRDAFAWLVDRDDSVLNEMPGVAALQGVESHPASS